MDGVGEWTTTFAIGKGIILTLKGNSFHGLTYSAFTYYMDLGNSGEYN